MDIVYDISVLGMGYYNSRARTGVFRVVENIAYGLAAAKECNLTFCASFSLENLNQSLDYLKSTSKLSNIPFIYSGLEKSIYINSSNLLFQLNKKSQIGLPHKLIRKILLSTNKLIESNTQLLDFKNLSNTNIFHSPFYALPQDLKPARHIKRFLTVYDLIPILYPHYFKFNEEDIIKNVVESLDADTWVICISNATKNDLCNYIKHLDNSKVFVTPLAASDLFYPCYETEKLLTVRKKYHIPPDISYVLSLSTLEPRKNIDQIIRCFASLIEQQNLQDLYLVLVGTKGWNYSKIFDEISNYNYLKNRIIVTGYVADEDLAALYSGALAFVYPSFYEGFGLPPLEAMQCGIPVITSNTSSLPEVVGNAGIMVAPTDSDALCHSMLEIYNKPSLREAMSLKSIEQAKKFSWPKCVQETISAYKTAVNS